MIYPTSDAYRAASHKRVLLFGMSGLGKTYLSALLRDAPREKGGGWFHYSVDYRIGTHYMGEHIADMFKREAMKVPLLRELLMTTASTSRRTSPSPTLRPCRSTWASRAIRPRAACPSPNT